MSAICSENSVDFHQTTRRYIQEDKNSSYGIQICLILKLKKLIVEAKYNSILKIVHAIKFSGIEILDNTILSTIV
jgi:hypothetical protein